ncbi:MAG: DUF1848 domain-containing protein [Clostridium sp.]|nr:DUF1848 domain-containing protein [Clostridium sp.]
MILSVSRRTDIPAFYSKWFINRINEGFLYVINPFNRKQVSKIELNQDTIDLFVFWTKDPEPMISSLDILDNKGFKYYFQFTLNSYAKDIEKGIRPKREIVNTFIKLSKKIGKEKVIWRYDPILLNKKYTKEYHYKWFEEICKKLHGYTDKCVISFIDLYEKTKRNTKELELQQITKEDMYEIGRRLSSIAKKYSIVIETCSEDIDLLNCGIMKGKCIDDKLISKIMDCSIDIKKDDTQREECGCVKSIDIGSYNTCRHYCAYCYANFNYDIVKRNCENYNEFSPTLVDSLVGDEKITIRKMPSIKSKNNYTQLTLDI